MTEAKQTDLTAALARALDLVNGGGHLEILLEDGHTQTAAEALQAALAAEGVVLVNRRTLAILSEAIVIGSISYEGDSWYAAHAGFDYDAAEATMQEARELVAALLAELEKQG